MMVSIIIPTYNSEKSLKECLASIVNQTYSFKEIILVDGLSTDKTIDIIKEFSLNFTYVRFVSEKDNGIYEAMNKGVGLAQGEWIFFLGSDDLLYNANILKTIFSVKENLDFDILYGDVYSTRFNGRYDGEFTARKIFNQNICHQAIFLKKKVFDSIGMFNLRFKAHADWEHNIRWFFNKKFRHKYIDEIISVYSDGGFSSVSTDTTFLEHRNRFFLSHSYLQIDKQFRKEILNNLIHEESTRAVPRLFYKLLYHLNRL